MKLKRLEFLRLSEDDKQTYRDQHGESFTDFVQHPPVPIIESAPRPAPGLWQIEEDNIRQLRKRSHYPSGRRLVSSIFILNIIGGILLLSASFTVDVIIYVLFSFCILASMKAIAEAVFDGADRAHEESWVNERRAFLANEARR